MEREDSIDGWQGVFIESCHKLIIPILFIIFKALSIVCNLIRKIQIQFLWGWGQTDRKIAWVA